MGLFDLPGPLLSAADSLLSFLSPLARLIFWAVFTGAVSMLCYWVFSAQDKVADAKKAAIDGRRALNAYEGHEFSEMWPLVSVSLQGSLRHFWVVLGPAVLGSLPALAVIVWVANQFGYIQPEAGAPFQIYADPAIELQLERTGEDSYTLTYPSADAPVDIRLSDGAVLTQLPLAAPVPIIHKKLWWNSLIANPAGYLADDAAIDEIYFEIESQQFLGFGPDWMRSWELSYFLLLIVTSLGIKFAFRID